MGPPDSGGVSRVPPYLGSRWAGGGLRARGCHPLRRAFPGPCARRSQSHVPVPLPRRAGPAVWASSAFARRYLRNHCCLLFLRLLRCFTSPGLAPPALLLRAGASPSRGTGCPIRTPPDQGPHAPPRGFSQLAASFVACRRQGIRRAPVQPGRRNRRQAGPACSAAPRQKAGALLLDEKTTVRGGKRRRARFYQGEMSLRPRRGAKPRGGRSLCLAGGPGIPAPNGRSRTSFPVRCQRSSASPKKADQWKMVVGAHGLGPWTSSLSETRSNQLSYAPGAIRAPRRGDGAMRRAWTGAAFRRACSSIRR